VKDVNSREVCEIECNEVFMARMSSSMFKLNHSIQHSTMSNKKDKSSPKRSYLLNLNHSAPPPPSSYIIQLPP